MTFAAVCKLASSFPGVEEGLSWGTPGLKVKGRFLARLKEDGESLVLRMDMLQRERLMKRAPQTFYITDHYVGSPAVLVRLAKVRRDVMKKLVEDAWRYVAPEALVAEYDGAKPRVRRKPARARRRG